MNFTVCILYFNKPDQKTKRMKPRAKEERVGGQKEMREEEERIPCRAGLEPGDREQLLANTDQCKVISDL